MSASRKSREGRSLRFTQRSDADGAEAWSERALCALAALLGPIAETQLVVVAFDDIEVQVDGVAVLVGMQDLCDLAADLRSDAQFFLQLAAKGFRRRLTRLDLAAGKLPLKRKRLVFRPLTAQNFITTQDKRGRNLLGQMRVLIGTAVA